MDVARVAYCARARARDLRSSSRTLLAYRGATDRTMTAKNSLALSQSVVFRFNHYEAFIGACGRVARDDETCSGCTPHSRLSSRAKKNVEDVKSIMCSPQLGCGTSFVIRPSSRQIDFQRKTLRTTPRFPKPNRW